MLCSYSEIEVEDARRREEADRVREDGRKRFAQEIKDRVEGLRGAVRGVKDELLAKGMINQSSTSLISNHCLKTA